MVTPVPVSFKEPHSSIADTLKSPPVFIYNPVLFPVPSVSCFNVAVIAKLSVVLIRAG